MTRAPLHSESVGVTLTHDLAETPIQTIFREWKTVSDFVNSPECPEGSEILGRLRDLEAKIAAQPSQTPEDLAAKIVVVTDNDAFDFAERAGPNNPKVWAEVRKLAGLDAYI